MISRSCCAVEYVRCRVLICPAIHQRTPFEMFQMSGKECGGLCMYVARPTSSPVLEDTLTAQAQSLVTFYTSSSFGTAGLIDDAQFDEPTIKDDCDIEDAATTLPAWLSPSTPPRKAVFTQCCKLSQIGKSHSITTLCLAPHPLSARHQPNR